MTKHQKPPTGDAVELPLPDSDTPTQEEQRTMLIEGVKDFDAKFQPETAEQLVDRMLASGNLPMPTEVSGDENNDSHPFDWEQDAKDIVTPTQYAIAVYENPHRQIVIRQEAVWPDEDDPIVVVDRANLQPLIDRLCDIAGIPAIGGP
jgi:hypothetical protein